MGNHIKKTPYSDCRRLLLVEGILKYLKLQLALGLMLTSVLIVIMFLSGCDTKRTTTSPQDYYYHNHSKSLAMIGRVSIVELGNDSSYPQISGDFTDTLYQALQKKQIFGLSVVRKPDTAWRSLQLGLDAEYGLEQIAAMRDTLRCDGILIGTITEFRPYPHMAIGLRLKLLDLTDGQLLWALEQVWDSADKKTEERQEPTTCYQLRLSSNHI